MFYDLSASETVQMIGAVFVIGTVSILGLVLLSILAPERLLASSEQATPAWGHGELGAPATFREPADLDEVDARARWHARAAVVYNPAPIRVVRDATTALPVPISPATPYSGYYVGARLDELMSVSPAMSSSSSARVTSPYSPWRIPIAELPAGPRPVDPTPVGRHRAPERALVGAAA